MVAVQVLFAALGALLAVTPINAISPDPSLVPGDVEVALISGDVPRPQVGGRLKQTTRSEVLIRQARRRFHARDSVPSGGSANVCTVSSTSANPTLRGAVFHNVATNDVSTAVGDAESNDIQSCADSCINNMGCDWSYLYIGRCYLRAGDQGDMGPLGGGGEDQFFYPGVTCAQQKAKQNGADNQECCELYY